MSILEQLAGKPDIEPLHDRTRGYLQVLVTNFGLSKLGVGTRVDLSFADDTLSISGGEGKRSLNDFRQAQGSSAREALTEALGSFGEGRVGSTASFDCSGYPLRFANGGVLPVIHLGDHDYFCLFYRDILPIGWNIANGASDNLDEMLDPGRNIVREFGEELLVFDKTQRVVYAHDPGAENRPPGFQDRALEEWGKILGVHKLEEYEKLSMPLKWIDGPDEVCVSTPSWRKLTGGYFLSITPEDGAIEVDRFGLIHLPADVSIIDGEIVDGDLLNRMVALFRVDGFRARLAKQEFAPDLYYFNGEPVSQPRDWKAAIAKSVDAIKPKHRTESQRAEYRLAEHKYDLCPISRSVIERYFRWTDGLETRVISPPCPPTSNRGSDPEIDNCEVFISYKSKLQTEARRLYDYLTSGSRKYRVFCSGVTLGQCGESYYFKAINRALKSAKCMVVMGSHPDHFESGWIEYEWTAFVNEKLSRRRPDAELFTLALNVGRDELPMTLLQFHVDSSSAAFSLATFQSLETRISAALKRGS